MNVSALNTLGYATVDPQVEPVATTASLSRAAVLLLLPFWDRQTFLFFFLFPFLITREKNTKINELKTLGTYISFPFFSLF